VDQVEVIAEKLDRIGPQIVSIGGGEPLLHPEIVEIVRVLARRHFPVMICNGWCVTPERARRLWEAGMYEISVSVDYADPARHDGQRGVAGAHARALEALRTLHRTRTSPQQRVHMISVIMDDNLEEVEALIRLCQGMGITYLVTLCSQVRGARLDRSAAADPSRKLLQLIRRHRHFVALRGYLARFTQAVRTDAGRCYAGKNLCNIDCNGDVALCIDRLESPVGNILRDDAGTIRRKLLERYRANRCRACWTSCRGSIETLMYGQTPLCNLRDYYQMAKPIPLEQAFA
jgi:MoaA/NifB/PqqE/SkfB family radical SAM enzyme